VFHRIGRDNFFSIAEGISLAQLRQNTIGADELIQSTIGALAIAVFVTLLIGFLRSEEVIESGLLQLVQANEDEGGLLRALLADQGIRHPAFEKLAAFFPDTVTETAPVIVTLGADIFFFIGHQNLRWLEIA
jgi:hypothetical protein